MIGKRSRITSDADDVAACGTSALAEGNMPIFIAQVVASAIKENNANQTVLIANGALQPSWPTDHELRRLGGLSNEALAYPRNP